MGFQKWIPSHTVTYTSKSCSVSIQSPKYEIWSWLSRTRLHITHCLGDTHSHHLKDSIRTTNPPEDKPVLYRQSTIHWNTYTAVARHISSDYVVSGRYFPQLLNLPHGFLWKKPHKNFMYPQESFSLTLKHELLLMIL